MELITAVLSFIVAIGVLVVIHEMGHFLVARLAGVKVLRFSIGFGKPIFQRRAKNGTEWTIGWLPLGGYVKMLDERESLPPDVGGDARGAVARVTIDPKDLPHAFNRQPVAKRFAIVAAGPIANFLLAIVLFALINLHGSMAPAAFIGTPPEDSAAARAGLSSGEQIVGLRRDDSDGNAQTVDIRSWPELQRALHNVASGEHEVTLIAMQDGNRYEHRVNFPPAGSAVSSDTGKAAQGTDDDAPESDLSTQLGLLPGGRPPQIVSLEDGSAAQRAGLRTGDVIVSVNRTPLTDVRTLVDLMRGNPGRVVQLGIQRGDAATSAASAVPATDASSNADHADARGGSADLSVGVTPTAVTDPATGHTIGRIGAALGVRLPMVDVQYGPIDALTLGVARTWDIAAFSVKMFGRMLSGKASLRNLSGPVTIADYAGRSARMGLEAFLSFLALVSISLGVLNLLPIPVLDGGHLLYYAVEAVTGRTPSERWQSIMQRAGLFCIVALSVVALFNDLSRLLHG